MTTDSSKFSIAQLEQLLDSRRTSLLDLAKRRKELVDEIAKLDGQIQQLVDLRTPAARPRRKRAVNARPLKAVVIEVLKKHKKGLNLKELAAKIHETGYRSNSANFTNVVYQAIYNSPQVELDEKSGCYRLKK